MNLNDLRGIIEEEGGKWIIVEDGKPVLVIVPFREYLKNGRKMNPSLPLDFVGYKPEQKNALNEARMVINMPHELAEEPLKIEDLPV